MEKSASAVRVAVWLTASAGAFSANVVASSTAMISTKCMRASPKEKK
jgi:hypothetical protein